MSLKRRIARLATTRDAGCEKADSDSLDRRHYDRAWRRFDRRAVAPALMGASMLFPGALEALDRAGTTLRGTDGPRESARESALRGARLYVPRNGPAARQAQEWRSTRPADAALLEYVASQPAATWFGDWTGDVAMEADALMEAAAHQGQVPVIVAHNLPNRDWGSDPEGGAADASAYRDWVRELARGIGDREAVVVLEPHALGLVSCMTHECRSERFSLIREAVSVLKARTDAFVYIAAGHARWVDAEEMAQRLHLAGVDRADGFALNVADFVSTEINLVYGEQLSRRLNGARFVIDTSRNGGAVAAGEWCNPDGAAMGRPPSTETGHPLADAFLWVRTPGESDGPCNGGPAAREWWGEYALELARGSEAG